MSGCFWRSYPARLRVHAEVMVAIARKGVDLVGAERFTAESMPELTYPLERAVAFATSVRDRGGEARASLLAFEALIDRYRAFVDALDRSRRERRGAAAAAALAEPLRAVEEAAAAVDEALRHEGAAQARGSSVTRLASFTVASSCEIDWPSCGCTTWGASSASGSSTKRRLCSSGCGMRRLRFPMTSWS